MGGGRGRDERGEGGEGEERGRRKEGVGGGSYHL